MNCKEKRKILKRIKEMKKGIPYNFSTLGISGCDFRVIAISPDVAEFYGNRFHKDDRINKIAARYLRRNGYKVVVIKDWANNPSYMHGFLVYINTTRISIYEKLT